MVKSLDCSQEVPGLENMFFPFSLGALSPTPELRRRVTCESFVGDIKPSVPEDLDSSGPHKQILR